MAANTDKFTKAARRLTGTIDASGVPDGTINNFGLSSASGLPTDTAVEITVDRVDSNGNKTPDKEEVIKGVVSGDRIVDAIRGVAGTAQYHAPGAVWEVRLTASQWNALIDGLLLQHNPDGSHQSTIDLPYGMTRQAIMNGNFDVWQRGTSFTPLVDTTTVFLADRWRDMAIDDGGTLPTLTRSRQLITSGEIPNAFYFSRLATNGAGASLGVNSAEYYRQSIEHGTRNLCGDDKKVTISFWAASSIANKRICPVLIQNYGTGGSPSAQEPIKGTPITLTSTWTKYTVTFTTNTLVGKTFGTNFDDSLKLDLYNQWGATYGNTYIQTGVTAETYVGAGNIDIAQVQLCAGEVALPFQPKSLAEELSACQRYYETGQTVGVPRSSDNVAIGAINYKATKRALPALTYSLSPGGTEFADQHGFGWFKASSASIPVKFTWYADAEI